MLIYIGAASGNWAPDSLQSGGDGQVRDYDTAITRASSLALAREYGWRETDRGAGDAEESFSVIVYAFVVSRAVLACQYLICELSSNGTEP